MGRGRLATWIAAAAALSAFGFAFPWHDLARPGYTADEEFTVFAVRGIAATGLPLLPSGLLYDRGPAYSYAAWAAGAADSLTAARLLSLASAIAALTALWVGVRRIRDAGAAWLAVLLVAGSIPFWAVATTARFYAPFLALYLTALAILAGVPARGARALAPAALGWLVIVVAACRWTHELAFTVAAVPLVCVARAPRDERRTWVQATAAVIAGLVVAQAGIFALHYLAPPSGGTMIRRFFLWQILNLFERPPLAAPVGVLLVAAGVAVMLAPSRARRFVTGATGRIVFAVTLLVLGWGAATAFHRALDYPLDLARHLGRTMPVLLGATLALLGARAAGLGGAWTAGERATHLLWVGWIVFFGVIDSGITLNYLLAPVTLMLAAVAVDVIAIARTLHERVGRALVVAATLAIVVGLISSGWGRDPRARFTEARPTIAAPDPAALRQAAASAEMVACTDELACLLLAGRVDRWLVLDDFLRERFVVSRERGDVGVYAGRPAIERVSDLFSAPAGAASPKRVLVIDVFKDLPVGPSSIFFPRALARERVSAAPLLETRQMRMVELWVPRR